MFVNKNINLKGIVSFSGVHILWITGWVSAVTILYNKTQWDWLSIPWLPLSLVGTAVAFYIGFKNNQAYDRLWEARKIWGGIVNSSRALGTSIKGFASDLFLTTEMSEDELKAWHKKIIYRHIAWIYALRDQLLIPTPWEHIRQSKHIARVAAKRMKVSGIGMFDNNTTKQALQHHLPVSEHDRLLNYKNTATQIIDQQSQDLLEMRRLNIIDDFRHMELQKILNDFYIHQGKCERIKKFPLPRQYASMSFVFVAIFIFLLPFGMVAEFAKLGGWAIWVSIPFSILVCWIYLMMELVGDYSENPFEGMGNDIPMMSLCRTIEIDLKEMLGETDLPPAIVPENGVLM